MNKRINGSKTRLYLSGDSVDHIIKNLGDREEFNLRVFEPSSKEEFDLQNLMNGSKTRLSLPCITIAPNI